MSINYEAITAGERALNDLNEALRTLDSARTWGIFDILGGGTFTTFLKHSKIEKAKDLLYQCRVSLWEFKNQLAYIPSVEIDISTFLTFADFLCDGLLADIIVQTRINEARSELSNAIDVTERALEELRLL